MITRQARISEDRMPGIKTQAQYDAAEAAIDAVYLVVNAMLTRDSQLEQDARQALDLSFDAIRKATELRFRLEDSPEAATSAAAQQFKEAPQEFQEVQLQRELMNALGLIGCLEKLNAWYATTKPARDRIVTTGLRNELIDAIRAKRRLLRSVTG